MPIETLKKLPPAARKLWERIFESNKQKFGAERAATIAWGAVKKLYKKTDGKWVKRETISRSQQVSVSSEKLICRSEGIGGVRDFFVEGYIATYTPQNHGEDDFEFTEELFGRLSEQITNFPVSIKGDIEHVGSRLERGMKVNLSDIPTVENIMRLEEHRIDNKGLWAKFKLDKNSPAFPLIWNRLQDGFYDAFSVELYPKKGGSSLVRIGDKYHKRLFDGTLKKVSLTSQPVDRTANITKISATSN